jgi:hypothetical protein
MCALLCAAGCLAQGVPEAEAPDTDVALLIEQARAQVAEERVAVLETRVAELQSRGDGARPNRETSNKLDHLIALQHRLESKVARLEAQGQEKTVTPQLQCPAISTTSDTERQVVELLERMNIDAPPWRGGLSREKREALRILLRPERTLDVKNPMEL